MSSYTVTRFRTIFYGVLILMAFGVFRIRDYADPSVDAQIVFRLLSWGLMLFIGLLAFKKITDPAEQFFLAFLLIVAISSVLSDYPVRGLIAVFSFVCAYLFVKSLFTHQRLAIQLLNHAFIPIFFVSVVFYFFYTDVGRHNYWMDGVFSASSRMSGAFGTSNAMAAAFSISVIFSFHTFCMTREKSSLVFCLISLLGLLLTDSKTAFAATILSIMFYTPLSRRKLITLHWLVVGCTILAFFVMQDPVAVIRSISRHGDIEEILTFTGRTYIWPAIIQLIPDALLFGHGLGVTSTVVSSLEDIIGYTPAHAHNLLLQSLFCTGLVGTAVLIFSVSYAYKINPTPLKRALIAWIVINGLTESLFLANIFDVYFIPLLVIILERTNENNNYSVDSGACAVVRSVQKD